MTLTDAIIARLSGNPAFSTAVKGRIGTEVELGGVPAVRVTIVSDPRPQHFKGAQRVRSTGVQIDIWALTAQRAEALAQDAIDILTPPGVVGGVRFQRATVTNVRHTREQDRGEGVKRAMVALYRASIDISLWHNG